MYVYAHTRTANLCILFIIPLYDAFSCRDTPTTSVSCSSIFLFFFFVHIIRICIPFCVPYTCAFIRPIDLCACVYINHSFFFFSRTFAVTICVCQTLASFVCVGLSANIQLPECNWQQSIPYSGSNAWIALPLLFPLKHTLLLKLAGDQKKMRGIGFPSSASQYYASSSTFPFDYPPILHLASISRDK